MTYAETMAALDAKRKEIDAIQAEMRTLQASIEPQPVSDVTFDGWDGEVRLSAMFGDKPDLILIHNMGIRCTSCTMWADGFNGVYDHLASRAAFALASPDPLEVQRKVAAARGWRFPMVRYQDEAFARAMGAWVDAIGFEAGVSVFRKDGERIARVSYGEFGPFDGFCLVYHLMDLVPGADPDWEPRYRYDGVKPDWGPKYTYGSWKHAGT
jgi:predicted dithiol-disulfide oxidoreductase (DUF899 family)